VEEKQPFVPDDHEWHDIDYRELPGSIRRRIETLHPTPLVAKRFSYRLVPRQVGRPRYQRRLRNHIPIHEDATFQPKQRKWERSPLLFLSLTLALLTVIFVPLVLFGGPREAKDSSIQAPTYTQAPTFTPYAEAQRITVYCIGDSITYGAGCLDEDGNAHGYPPVLQGLMSDLFPNDSWVVHNVGIGANTATQMRARFDNDCLSHSDCNYVIILGGTAGTILGESVSTIEDDLQYMYSIAHSQGVKVVALFIPPWLSYYDSSCLNKIKSINSWISSAAQNVDYRIDLFTLLEDPAKPNYLDARWSYDIFHLNCAGYDRVANFVFSEVNW